MDKIQNIESLLFNILTYTYLLPPVLLFIFWAKLKQETGAFLISIYSLFFFFLIFFEDNITTTKFSTRLYYQFFTFFEYLFFTGVFWLVIKNRNIRRIIAVFSVAFSIFQIVYFLLAKFKRIDSIPIGIESILVLIYIFYFFYELLREPRGKHLSENYCFWFAIGILIYLSGSFFMNILANVMDRKEIDDYWYFTYIADIIKNLFLVVGLIVMSRQTPNQEKARKNVPFLDMN